MARREVVRVGAVGLLLAGIVSIPIALLSYIAAHRNEENFARHALETQAVVVDPPRGTKPSTDHIWVLLEDERKQRILAWPSEFEVGEAITVLVDQNEPGRIGIPGNAENFRSPSARRLQLALGWTFLAGIYAAIYLLIDGAQLTVNAGWRRLRARRQRTGGAPLMPGDKTHV